MQPSVPKSLQEYLSLFTVHGDTDEEYLARHWLRFLRTYELFAGQWTPQRGSRVLDIGAHWLHLSVLFARSEYQLTASEFSENLQQAGLRSLAAANQIRLLGYSNLDATDVFAELGTDSVDVVLLCEVLEHMAFNPVRFWQSVYEVLAPGGRIVLTTPNFYFWKTRVRALLQFMSGKGGGVTVDKILHRPTYSHHWKEYSSREIRAYFRQLSPDFRINRLCCLSDRLTSLGPLGGTLYVEIDLPEKRQGIVAESSWV